MSSIGCVAGEVKVYDSAPNGMISLNAKQQVAAILYTQQPQITLTLELVQCQHGSSDCGLFAIAFATSLVKGENPVSVQYTQHSMRQHFLEKKKMDVFPRQHDQGRRLFT